MKHPNKTFHEATSFYSDTMENEAWNQAMQESSEHLWDRLEVLDKIHILVQVSLAGDLAFMNWKNLPSAAKTIIDKHLQS